MALAMVCVEIWNENDPVNHRYHMVHIVIVKRTLELKLMQLT